MTSEINRIDLERGIQGGINVGRGFLAVAMAAGIATFNGAPATAVNNPKGCSAEKIYEQTLTHEELNALAKNEGSEPAERERVRIANGVSGAGIKSGSEVLVGAGVNRSATDVPYPVFNEAIQDVLLSQGYRVVAINKLAVDSVAAGVLKVTQDAVDCPVQV